MQNKNLEKYLQFWTVIPAFRQQSVGAMLRHSATALVVASFLSIAVAIPITSLTGDAPAVDDKLRAYPAHDTFALVRLTRFGASVQQRVARPGEAVSATAAGLDV